MKHDDHSSIIEKSTVLSNIQRHSLVAMLVFSVLIALGLVVISMVLYTTSGTAQLDLSRPGYSAVRNSVENKGFEAFPSTGPLSTNALDQFNSLYTAKSKEVNEVDDFGGDVLSDSALGIDDTSEPTTGAN